MQGRSLGLRVSRKSCVSRAWRQTQPINRFSCVILNQGTTRVYIAKNIFYLFIHENHDGLQNSEETIQQKQPGAFQVFYSLKDYILGIKIKFTLTEEGRRI